MNRAFRAGDTSQGFTDRYEPRHCRTFSLQSSLRPHHCIGSGIAGLATIGITHRYIMLQTEMRCQQSDASTSGRDLLHQSSSPVRSTRRINASRVACAGQKEVTLLDYGAGNVRSVRNAILKLGYTLREVRYLSEAGWVAPTSLSPHGPLTSHDFQQCSLCRRSALPRTSWVQRSSSFQGWAPLSRPWVCCAQRSTQSP